MPHEDYKLTLNRAYYTYLTNNEVFAKEAKKIQKLSEVLLDMIYSSMKIDEFNKNPFEMDENEMLNLYKQLCEEYLPRESEERKAIISKKTLNNAEDVESIHMEENE